jgi:transposase-like protein
MKCPRCSSENIIKKSLYKVKKNNRLIRRYQCKDCNVTFTINTDKNTYLQKRPDLNKQIYLHYCEGNTLHGIARLLGITYKTVVRKFKFMAHIARELHLKNIEEKNIITTYVQFDEMESFEITKTRPLGIELAIRPKTCEILSAKVCRIPMKAHSVPYEEKQEYRVITNQEQCITEMLLETAKCLNENTSTLACDGDSSNIRLAKEICTESNVVSYVRGYNELWKLNHVCAKLRHHISRLTRKTWATTKKMERLQMHLDLFIAYQNGYEF